MRTTLKDDQALQRLPKWAQREIERLQANIKHLQTKLDSALAVQGLSEEGSAVVSDGKRPVVFRLGDDEYPYIRVNQTTDNQGNAQLEVYGSGVLLIKPKVSNGFAVQVTER